MPPSCRYRAGPPSFMRTGNDNDCTHGHGAQCIMQNDVLYKKQYKGFCIRTWPPLKARSLFLFYIESNLRGATYSRYSSLELIEHQHRQGQTSPQRDCLPNPIEHSTGVTTTRRCCCTCIRKGKEMDIRVAATLDVRVWIPLATRRLAVLLRLEPTALDAVVKDARKQTNKSIQNVSVD